MPRFAANLTLLFNEFPFAERFVRAKDANFDGVEILSPYDEPVPEIVDALSIQGLQMVLINSPPPNYTGGQQGFAAVPEAQARFRSDMRRVMRYAKALKVQHVHVMAGKASGAAAHACFIENLKWVTAENPSQSFTIEPLNPDDQPGYFLNDYGQAIDILAQVDAPNLGFQFDTYHAAKIHSDVMAEWDRARAHVRHVQIGAAPDRSEPAGAAFVDFFDRLDADGYDGWVSAEYHPKTTTLAGLGWLPR
ncbi:hydroxypyruvate isomerase family protein [Yoonia sp. 208BN28-4]|uniref:hydroxypyruvate isomerase family protein n=1 Tax=Yoonia sp. 208BN28-4 TaxID=3126505 RepID=UPI0030A0AF07